MRAHLVRPPSIESFDFLGLVRNPHSLAFVVALHLLCNLDTSHGCWH